MVAARQSVMIRSIRCMSLSCHPEGFVDRVALIRQV